MSCGLHGVRQSGHALTFETHCIRQSQQNTCPHAIGAAGCSRLNRQIPQDDFEVFNFDSTFFLFCNGNSLLFSGVFAERPVLDSIYFAICWADTLSMNRVRVVEAWMPINRATRRFVFG